MAEPSSERATSPYTISISEACARSGLGRTSIYLAIKTGGLKTLKIGTRRLIRTAELERWLAGHEAA